MYLCIQENLQQELGLALERRDTGGPKEGGGSVYSSLPEEDTGVRIQRNLQQELGLALERRDTAGPRGGGGPLHSQEWSPTSTSHWRQLGRPVI